MKDFIEIIRHGLITSDKLLVSDNNKDDFKLDLTNEIEALNSLEKAITPIRTAWQVRGNTVSISWKAGRSGNREGYTQEDF